MKSIRRHQATLLIAGALVLYLACAAVIYRAVANTLYDEFDGALEAKARAMGAMLEDDPVNGVELDFDERAMPEFVGPEPEYFQIWMPDASAPDAWREIQRSPPLRASLPRRHGPAGEPTFWDQELTDGRSGRAVGIRTMVRLDVDDDGDDDDDEEEAAAEAAAIAARGADTATPAIIVVARSREHLAATLGALIAGLLLAAGLVCAAIVPLVAWTIHRGMRPVARLGAHVGELGTDDLDRPLDERELPVELRPIVTGLNRLLGRLDEAFERERRTSANIAHELRTPIAELRTATDVATRWQDDRGLADDAVRTARSVAIQMERIVRIMLRLSRIESGQMTVDEGPVALRPLLERQWGAFATSAEARGLSFACDLDDALVAWCDEDALEMVVRNLLSNAAAHAPADDVIRVEARDRGDGYEVRISNSNRTLDADELARVSEAFWTKDASRADREHVGLGLAMVTAVGRATAIPVDLALDDGRFVATIRLRRRSAGDPARNGENGANGAGAATKTNGTRR